MGGLLATLMPHARLVPAVDPKDMSQDPAVVCLRPIAMFHTVVIAALGPLHTACLWLFVSVVTMGVHAWAACSVHPAGERLCGGPSQSRGQSADAHLKRAAEGTVHLLASYDTEVWFDV